MDVPGALGKLRSLRPDLILLDYGIPSPGEGENFLRAKAADSEVAAIPVILMSGYVLPSEIDGTVAIIPKSFDVERLLAVIEEVVGPPGGTEHERRVTRPRAPSVTRSATTSDPE